MTAVNGPVAEQPFTVAESTTDNIDRTGTIALAGRRYVLDTKGFARETLPVRKASQDQSATPGQQTLTDAGLWHRSQTDWSLGAGQPHYDRDNSDPRRFHSSKGVDPWTPGELRLLHETSRFYVALVSNYLCLSVGGILYITASIDSTTAYLLGTPDPFTLPATGFTMILGSEIRSITTDGAYVYVANEQGVHRTLVGSSTYTLFSTFQADQIAYANGRLIATFAGRIVEIDAAGVAGGDNVLDYTHPNVSFQWTSVASAPNAIYVSGYAGDRAEIYAIAPNTNTGGLRVPVFADSMPDGEVVNALAHYGSLMAIGTSVGVRCAQISGNGVLIHGPVIEIPGGVHAFEAQGESIWFSWSNYDSASTGLGRLNLRELTEPAVPAYASDIMASTQGRVTSIASHSGRRVFTIVGGGVWSESATLEPTGVLEMGELAWSTFAMKTAAAMDVRHAPLLGRVIASAVDEYEVEHAAGASDTAGTLGPENPFLLSIDGEALRPRIRLDRSDTTHGPSARRLTISAVVRPKRQDRYTLQLIIKSTVKDRMGRPITYDTAKEIAFLKSIEATGQVITLQIGDRFERVQIDSITQAEVDDWNDKLTDFQGNVQVVCLTQEPGI